MSQEGTVVWEWRDVALDKKEHEHEHLYSFILLCVELWLLCAVGILKWVPRMLGFKLEKIKAWGRNDWRQW